MLFYEDVSIVQKIENESGHPNKNFDSSMVWASPQTNTRCLTNPAVSYLELLFTFFAQSKRQTCVLLLLIV